MTVKIFEDKEINTLRLAVEAAGSLERLRLTYAEYLEFLNALAWFMGGSLESVDAFVTQMPGTRTESSGSRNDETGAA